jgi:hypothetical protein
MVDNNYWVVNLVSVNPSTKVPGSVCYHISLINLKTQLLAKTYVEASYGNYKQWRRIIEDSDYGQVLTNLKVKDINGKVIVSADSKPRQEIVAPKEEVAAEVSKFWQAA